MKNSNLAKKQIFQNGKGINSKYHSNTPEEEDLLPIYPIRQAVYTTRKKAVNDTMNNNSTKHTIGPVPAVYIKPNKNNKKRKNRGSNILIWWLSAAILFSIYKNYKFLTVNTNHYRIHSSSSKQKRKIAFVHIGKTGGSTASQMIRHKCFRTTPSQCDSFVKENLQDQLKIIGPDETEISKQTHSYFHIRKVQVKEFKSFIVTVRHPIERMISWYNHYHPKNRLVWFKRRPFFDCYPDLDEMATIGLSNKIHNNCTNVAMSCITGNAVFTDNNNQNRRLKECEHMFYNYHFYTGELLQSRNKEIFVLRTEQFWDDWSTINIILGGDKDVHKVETVTHSKGKNLAVTNRAISKEGLENVCRVLCTEIQLYKQLIWRGVNLDIEDKKLSIGELEKTCPTQTNVNDCP